MTGRSRRHSCLEFLIERELQSRAGRPLADYRRARVVHLTLHAERIVLPAAWGEPREFSAPLPADFAAALEALRRVRL